MSLLARLRTPSAPPSKPTTGSKVKPRVTVPKHMRSAFRRAAAVTALSKWVASRKETLTSKVKERMLRYWAEQFFTSGSQPQMTIFEIPGENCEMGYLVTSRTKFAAKHQEALEGLGVDVSPYLDSESMTIDLGALRKLGSKKQDAVLEALEDALYSGPLSVEEAQSILQINTSFNAKRFLSDLPSLTKAIHGGEGVAVAEAVDTMVALVDGAGLSDQIRGAKTDSSNEETLQELERPELVSVD